MLYAYGKETNKHRPAPFSARKARGKGPSGKARQVFEEVSKLSRHHQDQIVKVVTALVAQAKAS